MSEKSRVFISCSQLTEIDKYFGEEVVKYFESRGFEAYFAESVHSVESLTENIFDSLKRSEYAVIINTLRDNSGDAGSIFAKNPLTVVRERCLVF